MGRYEHDPTKVVASITVLPRDDYEFELGRPKAFERTARKGHQSYGIRIPLTVVGGSENGKRTVLTLYLHSEGAQSMTKRFEMAVAGFSSINERTEKEFNSKVAGRDASYDTETGEVGEYWASFEGIHLMCDVDTEPQKDPDTGEVKLVDGEPIMQQTWGTWRPLEAVEA